MRRYEPGDLMACYGVGWKSKAISYGTLSLFAPQRLRIGPSHVAIICEHREQLVWVESTTLCRRPCLLQGTHTAGVQIHDPDARVIDYLGDGGSVNVYRLSPIDTLTTAESQLLTTILINHFASRSIKYDLGHALISGTRIFKRTRLLPRADLNELFCSELVAAVLMRLNRMNRDNPTRFNPADLVRRVVREGTYQFVRSES